jgi:uncharacterized repeat protein (TIGR01451 family)
VFKRFIMVAALCAALPAHAGVNTWTSVGPDGTSAYGGVNYLHRTGHAVVVTTQGIYRTTNDGASWSRTFQFPNYGIYAGLAANPHPSMPDLVLAHGDGSNDILRSVDGGATWVPVTPAVDSSYVSAVAFSRDGQIAWAAKTDGSIYRSVDAGVTWVLRNTGIITFPIDQFEVDATDTNLVYAHSGNDVWRTIDGGTGWTQINGTDPYYTIAASRSTHNVLLAVRSVPSLNVYRSVDGGITFTATALQNVTAMEFDPATPGRVLAADSQRRVHSSLDEGATWTARGRLPPGTPMQLALDFATPANTLLATNAGIAHSGDGGQTWVDRHAGVREAYFGSLVAGHSPSNYLYATSYDSKLLYRRDPSTGQWSGIGAAADPVVITATDTGNVSGFAETAASPRQLYLLRDNRVGLSNDDGLNWQQLGSVTDARSLTLDPTNPLVAYLANFNFASNKSIDGGVTWTPLAGGLPVGIASILVDPSSPQTLYGARDPLRTSPPGLLFKSTDGGLNWARSDTGIAGTYLWRLVMHPSRPATLYAAVDTGLWVSNNSGASWAIVFNNSVFDVAVDPQSADILYVSTNGSAYGSSRSVDAGLTWESLRVNESGGSFINPLYLALVPGQPATLVQSRAASGLWEMEIAPDVRIAANATILTMGVAETVTYTLSNDSAFSATGLTFSLALPTATGVTVTSGSVACNQASLSVTCSVPILRAGASIPVTVALTPSGHAEELRAIASAYESDPVVSNNVLEILTQRRSNLRAQVTSSTDSAQTGNPFTYSINVTNLGPSAAADVVADLLLPANVAFTGVTTTGLTCALTSGVLRCTAASLAVDASVSANITVNAVTAGAASASLTVTGEGTDPDATNNVGSKAVTLTDPTLPGSGSSSSSSSSSSSGGASASSSSGGGGGGGGGLDYLLLALLGAAAGLRRR